MLKCDILKLCAQCLFKFDMFELFHVCCWLGCWHPQIISSHDNDYEIWIFKSTLRGEFQQLTILNEDFWIVNKISLKSVWIQLTNLQHFKSIPKCKTAVTPLLMHWSCCSLVLSGQCNLWTLCLIQILLIQRYWLDWYHCRQLVIIIKCTGNWFHSKWYNFIAVLFISIA